MALTLTDYRADLDNILATAIDSSTWTSTIKDEALRQALQRYSLEGPVYETNFTVASANAEQDLSSITDIYRIIALAWPWSAGENFLQYSVNYRLLGNFNAYIKDGIPVVNEIIRVRYRKQHKIQNLDSAASTTVNDVDRRTIAVAAAIWCLELRIRQLAENPAIPDSAITKYVNLKNRLEDEYLKRIETLIVSPVNWKTLGL